MCAPVHFARPFEGRGLALTALCPPSDELRVCDGFGFGVRASLLIVCVTSTPSRPLGLRVRKEEEEWHFFCIPSLPCCAVHAPLGSRPTFVWEHGRNPYICADFIGGHHAGIMIIFFS